MIENVVKVKAKAGLQPVFFIREMDHQTQQGNCFAYVTAAKVQTQGTAIKDPKIEKPKPKAQDLKPANNSSNNVEISEKP